MQQTLLYHSCQWAEGNVLITPAKALGLLPRAEHPEDVICDLSDQVGVRGGALVYKIYHSLGTKAMKVIRACYVLPYN